MSNSKKQTVVMAMANAFREWQKEWDSYKGTNQPKSFDEFIEPFLQMKKEQIMDAFGVGCQVESTRLIGYHGMAEQYYNKTYGNNK